jgi:hypothetical protein
VYGRAVLRAAGRDLRLDNRTLEIVAHDCALRFVGGFGVRLTIDGVDVEMRAEQIYRPRLILPDGVTPYHMESLVIFDIMDRISGPGFPEEVVVRTTGHLTEGGPEVLLGCEAVLQPSADSMSIMVSPLRADYPEGHPCRRYL